MGTDTNIACKTCKKIYYCGYGGYGTAEDRASKFPAEEHRGHDVTGAFNTDYLVIKEDGHLWEDLAGVVWHEYIDQIFIENYRDFERIDL